MLRRIEGLSVKDAAKVRLVQWAVMLRAIYRAGAPNPNCYSEQPFLNGRIDADMLRHYIEQDERLDRVEETHKWVMELQAAYPAAYEALYVRYVQREPGTGRALQAEDQYALFKKRTGLRKTRFYECLGDGERYIGFRLLTGR